MGGWKLESGRFALLILFPVGAFWIFNQPNIFKHFMTGYQIPDTSETDKKMAAMLKQFKEQRQKEEYEKLLREQMAFEEARRLRESLKI